MIRNEKINTLFMMLITTLILSCVLTISFTFAKYFHTTLITDSAVVAKFDIDIIAPPELEYISNESPFSHSFSEKDQYITFDFMVTNNREVTVICTPNFDEQVAFIILIDGKEYKDFIIEVGETINFTVVVFTDELGVEATDANLILEVEQI